MAASTFHAPTLTKWATAATTAVAGDYPEGGTFLVTSSPVITSALVYVGDHTGSGYQVGFGGANGPDDRGHYDGDRRKIGCGLGYGFECTTGSPSNCPRINVLQFPLSYTIIEGDLPWGTIPPGALPACTGPCIIAGMYITVISACTLLGPNTSFTGVECTVGTHYSAYSDGYTDTNFTYFTSETTSSFTATDAVYLTMKEVPITFTTPSPIPEGLPDRCYSDDRVVRTERVMSTSAPPLTNAASVKNSSMPTNTSSAAVAVYTGVGTRITLSRKHAAVFLVCWLSLLLSRVLV